jgi:hypothetical protein
MPETSRKTPGGLLHVGLELVDGVVELGVPLVDERQEHIHQLGRAGGVAAMNARAHVVEQAHVADEQPDVAERHQVLGIAFVDDIEVGQFTDVMPNGELQIPERLQHRLQKPFFRLPNRAVERNEQVEIGVQAEGAAAVAANRGDDPGGGRLRGGATRDVSHESIERSRKTQVSGPAASSRPRVGRVGLARRRQTGRPRRANGGVGWRWARSQRVGGHVVAAGRAGAPAGQTPAGTRLLSVVRSWCSGRPRPRTGPPCRC